MRFTVFAWNGIFPWVKRFDRIQVFAKRFSSTSVKSLGKLFVVRVKSCIRDRVKYFARFKTETLKYFLKINRNQMKFLSKSVAWDFSAMPYSAFPYSAVKSIGISRIRRVTWQLQCVSQHVKAWHSIDIENPCHISDRKCCSFAINLEKTFQIHAAFHTGDEKCIRSFHGCDRKTLGKYICI